MRSGYSVARRRDVCPPHGVADKGRLLDTERIHELDDCIHMVEAVHRARIGQAPAGHINREHAELARQRFNVAGEVAPTGGARTAAMQQDDGMTFTGFVILQVPVASFDGTAGAGLRDRHWYLLGTLE